MRSDDGEALRKVAALHLRNGSPAAAADAHGATTCQGLRTPALTAFARPLPLTRREREIAHLAAAGLTNQQIATRLTLSIRTVEGHLYRLCAKLGITSRTELNAALSPQRARPEPDLP
ncbi:helix-turn-helix transcriptional regulator [Streptomyces sp. NPDC050418]|uniref:helix-turn-helix transcriptional regulator n=1 Tax=Streptomyces sp. NPDC050418 TaxID=3365612 RepID=UPI0037BA10D1